MLRHLGKVVCKCRHRARIHAVHRALFHTGVQLLPGHWRRADAPLAVECDLDVGACGADLQIVSVLRNLYIPFGVEQPSGRAAVHVKGHRVTADLAVNLHGKLVPQIGAQHFIHVIRVPEHAREIAEIQDMGEFRQIGRGALG